MGASFHVKPLAIVLRVLLICTSLSQCIGIHATRKVIKNLNAFALKLGANAPPSDVLNAGASDWVQISCSLTLFCIPAYVCTDGLDGWDVHARSRCVLLFIATIGGASFVVLVFHPLVTGISITFHVLIRTCLQ